MQDGASQKVFRCEDFVFSCGTSNPFNFGSLKSAKPGFSLCGSSEG